MNERTHDFTEVQGLLRTIADSVQEARIQLERDTLQCVRGRDREGIDIGMDAMADLESIEKQLRNVFAAEDAPVARKAVAAESPTRRRKSSSGRAASDRKRPVRKRKVEKYYYEDDVLWLHCKPKVGNEYWHKADGNAIEAVSAFVNSLESGAEFDFDALEKGCASVKSYQIRLVLRFLREKVKGVESKSRGRYARRGKDIGPRLEKMIAELGPVPKESGS